VDDELEKSLCRIAKLNKKSNFEESNDNPANIIGAISNSKSDALAAILA
jgi:hypothetical protein